MNKENH